jgi:ADP-heptose:LPS heptosyltransferase
MPTANRRQFVAQAIRLFLMQDYPHKELLILDDGEDSVANLIPSHRQVRYMRRTVRQNVGAKRNLACEEAHGEIIVHWDDDDWSAPWRLSYQVGELIDSGSDVCGLDRVFFLDPKKQRAWEYVYPPGSAPWVHGGTLCYRKHFWRRNQFPEVNVGEDSQFLWNARDASIKPLTENGFFVGLVHGLNTSPKQTNDLRWQPRTTKMIADLMGREGERYVGGSTLASERPSALVSAASGIGDIIRCSPLIRVLFRLGYEVDVLLAADYPETANLLRGAPEIRRIIEYPDLRRNQGAQSISELAGSEYEIATFTTWSAPLARWVKARQSHTFAQTEWLAKGDIFCVDKIARAVGWQRELPTPFVMPSARKFDLPPRTVALHPGCKLEWPWKRWHGFEGLARLIPNVVILGTQADLDNSQTYFKKNFEWPLHAADFVGKLDLADTAALISQCAALVSNDSGLMHIGVALGVPTFGVFGITNPEREIIPSRWMIPLSKGLPCEPACRRQAWGRRDCEHHLECLKSLTPEEVAERIQAEVRQIETDVEALTNGPALLTGTFIEMPSRVVRLNYYGYVFDASGYGQAARAYIHAMHRAGIKISVVDIGGQPSQVKDDLVASLLGVDHGADFNLFHGIPPQWARLAYPLRNVIAMTVWETDTMPQQWRNPLTHALDVWLPCAFNVEVFSHALGRPVFRLPHVFEPALDSERGPAPPELERLGLHEGDFVFYSILEWQERKNPRGMMEAFLRAFPDECDAVMVLKTNPGAAAVAAHTMNEVRRLCNSRARIVMCCEGWDNKVIRALHQRGDCYVSLHKGEGWGYPLFEAACLGIPVVATDYSGPKDYLSAEFHWLVRHRPIPVQQPYAYYHPSMRWAEPDLEHASEGIRWSYDNQAQARARARQAGSELTRAYLPEIIGSTAKSRLLTLLHCTDPARSVALRRQDYAVGMKPPRPIPGNWYNADYFEYGLKSNWDKGYNWSLFKGLFEETAAYLAEMFPEARSFLDVGCAKGFLVRTLRERDLEAWGFDHSPWAIGSADSAVKPFLLCADVATASYDRQFDILVAMSLFEGLTEEQIHSFLSHSRAWTRHALFATIVTREPNSQDDSNDHDLAHITMRDRLWWHERFLEAGWRQDPLHRIVQRLCQKHALVARMGWQVYLYLP